LGKTSGAELPVAYKDISLHDVSKIKSKETIKGKLTGIDRMNRIGFNLKRFCSYPVYPVHPCKIKDSEF
jgi:hypothetical protein